MADLDVWKDYVTVINAARLNAIRDRIITNEGNISYQQTLINANTTSIYTNSNNIANLSDIKLSRDGSQPMTGTFFCPFGIKTNTIGPYSGYTLECIDNLKVDGDVVGDSINGLDLRGEDVTAPAKIQLMPGNAGKIVISTGTPQLYLIPRIEIPGGAENVDIQIRKANLVPTIDGDQNLGSVDYRWREIYAVRGHFDSIDISQNMPFYLENPSSSDKYLLGAGTVSTMYQFNTTVTLIGYKLMMLTSASNGYIKVTIDDAKGWNYEKTYSLGSAGGYRYNESFIHIIETDNGIQLKISNCSQISSTSIVLEYK